jgi:ketosteroid isomerase-like protein
MRPRFGACLGFWALIAALPLSAEAQSPCPGPKDVCEFFASFLGALNRRDWDAFRASLSDDITVIFDRPGPSERQEGRLAVEGVFRNRFAPAGSTPSPLPPPVQPDSVLVQAYGDVAIVSFHLRGPDQLGRRTLVFHRTTGGWKVVHIHGSSVALPGH